MPELPSIPRVSREENLEKLYKNIATSQNVAVDPYTGGIRSNLVGRTTSQMAWGLSSKAGTPSFTSTDLINGNATGYGWDSMQKNFKANQPVKVTQFTPLGLNYARAVLKHDNRPYYG